MALHSLIHRREHLVRWLSPSVSAGLRSLASTFVLELGQLDAPSAALSTIMAAAQLAEEPTARNSKRLPVKANGEVRLRSVLSSSSVGICEIPLDLEHVLGDRSGSHRRPCWPRVWSSTCRQLRAEETRDDGRGRLVGAQTVGVGGAHDRRLEQAVVLVVRPINGIHQEGDELQVLMTRSYREPAGSRPYRYPATSCCACPNR